MSVIKVEGYSDLVRNVETNAIVKRSSEYAIYMKRFRDREVSGDKFRVMCSEINNLKKDLREIKDLIKKLNSSIPILLWDSVIDTINSVDAVVVISPEIYGTSTILLESMILDKPTMNIYFDKEIPKYEHVKQNAVLTITDSDNIELNLDKILFDKKVISDLGLNANNFLAKFMSNQGNASHQFALKLQSF